MVYKIFKYLYCTCLVANVAHIEWYEGVLLKELLVSSQTLVKNKAALHFLLYNIVDREKVMLRHSLTTLARFSRNFVLSGRA